MSTEPETDIREALSEAAQPVGLTLDSAAILHAGRRAVHRRQLVTAGAGIAAAAVLAVVAVQIGGGSTRALPPAGTVTTSGGSLGPTSPIDESGLMGGGDGTAARVRIVGDASGRVTETWTLLKDAGDGTATPFRTVTRQGVQLRDGEATFLMPAESGLPNAVFGYVAHAGQPGVAAWAKRNGLMNVLAAPALGPTSRDQVVMPLIAPLAPLSDATPGSTRHDFGFALLTGRDTGAPAAPPVSDFVGIVWQTGRGQHAVLIPGSRPDVTKATVTAGTNEWVLWATEKQIGLGGVTANNQQDVTGPLQVAALLRGNPQMAFHNDLAYGWVDGSDEEITASSSDRQDSFIVAYGAPVEGRRPFVVSSTAPEIRGTVTLVGAGTTRTIDFAAIRSGEGSKAASKSP